MRIRKLELAVAAVGACFVVYFACAVADWPPFRDRPVELAINR